MATDVPDVISSNQPSVLERCQVVLKGKITVVFDIQTNKKSWFQKHTIRNLVLSRANPARLRDLAEHLETQLMLPSGHARKYLLLAICDTANPSKSSRRIVPLVCEEIWALLLQHYPHSRLKVLIDQQHSLVATHSRSCKERFFGRQVKYIDIKSYLPSCGLAPDDILNLCHTIFEKRSIIKHTLRKGVWMHLVGVFPPELKARRQRETYMENLRMVYDSLKGKWKGEQGEQSVQVNQLVEAVHRDAVRTDPSHPFYSKAGNSTESLSPDSMSNLQDQSNIQKLINIITIYILEHDGVSYTQGMTDLLSPFLYVMKREADAYICFAAMVERIKSHFNTWCEGTLLKIERLRHICEVLDPELFHFLTNKIEEDAFALFFGMVLIECRREFSFEDSFQLLETVWAGARYMRGNPLQGRSMAASEWARFMTYNSTEVIQQVLGETETPYSAQPLPRSYSDTMTSVAGNCLSNSRNPSLLSQGSLGSHAYHHPSVEPTLPWVSGSSNMTPEHGVSHPVDCSDITLLHSAEIQRNVVTVDIESVNEQPQEPRPRSYTDPNLKLAQDIENKLPSETVLGVPSNLSPSHLSSHSRSESELYDSFSNAKLPLKDANVKTPTEMADLSSMSSDTISTSGNFQSAQKLNKNVGTADDTFKHPTSSMNTHTTQSPELESTAHTVSPQSTSGSSLYQTANDESTSDQGTQASSSSYRVKRALRRGDRIITESIPDESHMAKEKQGTTSTQNRQPIASSLRQRNPVEDNGHHTDDTERSRITPVAFFDVMGTIASSAPGSTENSGTFDHGGMLGNVGHAGVNADVSLIMSQLTLSEHADPRVTREHSLVIPFHECFPLFVCMAILSQYRVRIMQSSTDFVGLSVILNTQAAQQDIEKTLNIARDLYRMYRSYQLTYIGDDSQSLNTWLDDNEKIVAYGFYSIRDKLDSIDSVFE